MNITVHIPDVMATPLAAAGGNLERRALEALAAEEYRAGRLSKPQLCAALGFEVLDEFDGFLKAHGVFEEDTLAEFEREQEASDRLAAARAAAERMKERRKGVTLGGITIKELISEGRP